MLSLVVVALVFSCVSLCVSLIAFLNAGDSSEAATAASRIAIQAVDQKHDALDALNAIAAGLGKPVIPPHPERPRHEILKNDPQGTLISEESARARR
jgi:hypothetical protein